MSYSDLVDWGKNKLSKQGSQHYLYSIIRINSYPKDKLRCRDLKNLIHIISILKKSKKLLKYNSSSYSKKQLILKNMGFDVMRYRQSKPLLS